MDNRSCAGLQHQANRTPRCHVARPGERLPYEVAARKDRAGSRKPLRFSSDARLKGHLQDLVGVQEDDLRRLALLTLINRPIRSLAAVSLWMLMLIGVVIALFVAWVGTTDARASIGYVASVHHCRDVGPPRTDVGLYHITATRISCRKARIVLRRWYYDRSAPNSGPRGWRCSTRQTSPYSFRTACTRRRARIGFTRYSA